MTTTTSQTTTLLDDAAVLIRTVLSKWTPGNPARLDEGRAWLARYDEIIAMEQRAADRAWVDAANARTRALLADTDDVCGF